MSTIDESTSWWQSAGDILGNVGSLVGSGKEIMDNFKDDEPSQPKIQPTPTMSPYQNNAQTIPPTVIEGVPNWATYTGISVIVLGAGFLIAKLVK